MLFSEKRAQQHAFSLETVSRLMAFSIAIFAVVAVWITWPYPTMVAQSQSPSRPEGALVNELVLANRMLASEESGFLDAFGSVSVRSRSNPSHFYMAHSASPGLVTANDIIESDLDSKPVSGEESGLDEERFIHGEIYKARSDVMAVVHSHTLELAAFGVSSVPLRVGDNTVPIFDIRTFNNGRGGTISTPALGRSMAQSLGNRNAILLRGGGTVVVASSIYDLVGSANRLRANAKLQQQLIALGGQWDSNPQRVAPNLSPPATAMRLMVPTGTGGGTGPERVWEYWKQVVTPLLTGPNQLPRANRATPQADDPHHAIIDELACANRILSHKELGILGAYGHVSVRNPRNPNHYFISRYVSAAFVTADDIIENDLDSKPIAGSRTDQYQEIYMHGEIYKARPDVMAIVHAHTQEVVAFTESSVTLRPVINRGMFIGERLPIHDIRKFDPREILINTPELGRSVATVLANQPAVLLKGHGFALTGSSLHDVVVRAYQLRMNAKIQQQAIALGGTVTYLDQSEEAPSVQPAVPRVSGSDVRDDRAWEYWKQLSVAK
jgi:ribulose-5-phosphate 4-epimerase/fuculose-1-phosphate aldolase